MTNNLKQMRNLKNLTLKEMSEQIGIPRATLGRYENEDSSPKNETWQKLADFFDANVIYLMGLDIDESRLPYLEDISSYKELLNKSDNQVEIRKTIRSEDEYEILSCLEELDKDHISEVKSLISRYVKEQSK